MVLARHIWLADLAPVLQKLIEQSRPQSLDDAHEKARESTGDPHTAKQRRADALDDLVSVATDPRHPLGVAGVSVIVDTDRLSGRVGALLGDGNASRSTTKNLTGPASAAPGHKSRTTQVVE